MAYTKLTKPQERFVQELVNGKSQRKAYKIAYPKSKASGASLDVLACNLWANVKIKLRYDELLEISKKNIEEKAIWTREKSIATLAEVVEKNKAEIERIQQAADDELDDLLKAITDDPENAERYAKELVMKRQKKRILATNNNGIINAVSELNKMQGYNEETINMNGTVVFEGEDKLDD